LQIAGLNPKASKNVLVLSDGNVTFVAPVSPTTLLAVHLARAAREGL
jgi:Mg2+/citrate symporter